MESFLSNGAHVVGLCALIFACWSFVIMLLFNKLHNDLISLGSRIDSMGERIDDMGARIDAANARIDDVHREIMALIKSKHDV